MLCVAVPQVLSELLPPIVSGDSLWSACSLVWLFLSGTFLRHPLHCICKTRKVYFRGGRSVCRRVTRKSRAIKKTLQRGVMDLKTLLFIHKGLYQRLLTKPLWLCPETRSLAKIAESGPGWPKMDVPRWSKNQVSKILYFGLPDQCTLTHQLFTLSSVVIRICKVPNDNSCTFLLDPSPIIGYACQ